MAIWEISGSMESLGSDSEEDGCEVYDLWGHGLQDTYRESAARESASRESPGVVITTRNDGFYHYSPDSSPIATGSHTCYMFSEGDLDDYFPERFQVGRRNKTCVSLSSECRGGEMDTKSTTMDFGIHFETGNLGLPETFFSVEDMLNYSNEDIAGPIGEGESLVSGENVSNMGTSNTAGELNSKFSDIDLQRAGELNSGHSGNAQGVEQLKADLSFDVHRDIITHEFPAIDPLSVPYDDNDWLSTLNLNLLDGPFPCEEKAGYGEDFFGMHGETSMTCNQSSITSDQKSFRGNDKSITGTQRSYRDPFVSSSPVSVLESTSVSSSNTRGDGNCAINVEHTNINHGDQSHHNQLYKEQSVPGRARSKRLRTTGHMWGNARILADASSVSSTNPATATDAETTFSSDSSLFSDSQGVPGGGGGAAGAGAGGGNVKLKRECLNSTYSVPPADDMQNISHMLGMMTPPPKAVTTAKKPSKPGKNSSSSSKDGAASASSAETSNQQQPWRCLHCGSQRTPQWRAGPKGPKTLCNACGVRFKSGRLVDEYRPAGSPGFDSNKHSNCHKKILERRRQSSSQPIPVPLKTTFKNEPMPYHPLGLPTGVEFQSIGTYAPPHPFSSSPRGLDVDRTSCS